MKRDVVVHPDDVTRERWKKAAAKDGLSLEDWIIKACDDSVRVAQTSQRSLSGGKVFRGPDPKPGSEKKSK